MILYGRNPIREAIRGPRTVTSAWATSSAAREPWLSAVPLSVVTAEEIAYRSGSPDHQGVCAEVSAYVYAEPDTLLSAPDRLIVALDQVQDPQNLGAICRTAECAGVGGIAIPDRRAAEVTAAVCKASAGAVEHVSIARVRNLTDFLLDAKRQGRWCYGAQSTATTAYDELAYDGPAVLVLGSEGRGLRPRVAAACDLLVAIPQRGKIESLSVSAAAAILIYAATGHKRVAARTKA